MAQVVQLLKVSASPLPCGFRPPHHRSLLGVEGRELPLGLLPPVRKDQKVPQLEDQAAPLA